MNYRTLSDAELIREAEAAPLVDERTAVVNFHLYRELVYRLRRYALNGTLLDHTDIPGGERHGPLVGP